ncbi:DUF1360 domain-containing protein [Streptomyces sp. SAI-127]|uniref:DUF1360 domain-containing protein n=1 Tax=Streptomyces sp. SAI-127 TaxID=2940543 RepID=UPI0024749AED|nr:DUF1360 domain-containing protein [Streptomyces sp. SAI-127]MDH6489650.1 hypothetical protein [Streptomyces sp. SAI-127]
MIDLTHLALLGLAGYRGTQLAVHDTILDPARDRIIAWHEARQDSTTRSAVVTLISCVYCMGWWVSGALLATYLLATGTFTGTPLLVHGVEWLAVAGLAVLLNRLDDMLSRVHG